MTQIRRSQFITTYGPGAILEGPHGPRIIPSLEHTSLFRSLVPVNFEITDSRLSKALLNGARIVRLPSNAELGKPEGEDIYWTKPFPQWSLCTKHSILYTEKNCPQCLGESGEQSSWDKANREAVRFVRACPAGHLDDVDWVYITHSNRPNSNCHPSWLRWKSTGGALRYIDIECPSCGASINLGIAYGREWPCSGRFPEREGNYDPYRPENCDKKARIIQRGASNLRITEIVSSLTIPESDTRLHRYLEMTPLFVMLRFARISSKEDLLEGLRQLQKDGQIQQTIVNEIEHFDEETILKAISDVLADLPKDPLRFRNQELAALKHAASYGRTLPPSSPGYPPQFEVIRDDVRLIQTNSGHTLRITPVNRLRVVMVQKGYQRVPAGHIQDCDLVDVSFQHNGYLWYPGTELFGEGIFIDVPDDSLIVNGKQAEKWLEAWHRPDEYLSKMAFTFDRQQFYPLFVWWHTFSHRLINALAIDSGYSSAAIRERVYIDVDEKNGNARGGILLYTSQPGGDGTLGGLIALVREFERVLQRALYNLDACSNDPLCGEEEFGPGKHNGAACYACALVSETSCEHRNMSLDRNLLLENLP
ncbi:MAG: DUF1998 domain-containing protein [Anaerolineales bacterium]